MIPRHFKTNLQVLLCKLCAFGFIPEWIVFLGVVCVYNSILLFHFLSPAMTLDEDNWAVLSLSRPVFLFILDMSCIMLSQITIH